jgi:hypothetical protein
MSDQDDLRVRLARLDPAPRALDPVESPRAPELLERIMATPVLSDPEPAAAPNRTRKAATWGLAAAAAAAIAVGAAVVASDGGSTPTKAPTTLALKLPDPAVMSSCIQFDVKYLKDMSPAFAGTVTSVSEGTVVLDVDKWYTGGSADRVQLSTPGANSSASLDGVQFEVGKKYLVTAAEGNVNGCGYSGLATPQLQSAYDEAFGG